MKKKLSEELCLQDVYVQVYCMRLRVSTKIIRL